MPLDEVRKNYDTLGALLAERARMSAELEAVVDIAAGERFSFSQLNERCNRIANALADRVRPGDRLGLLAGNSHWYCEIAFAAAKLGAILVPLNWRLTADELAFQIADCDPVLIIFDAANTDTAMQLQAAGSGKAWMAIGDRDTRGSLCALMANAGNDEPDRQIATGDGWLILYTSGTTGRPKGALHTHESSIAWCRSTSVSFDIQFADRQLLVAPMFHIAGICLVIGAAHRGLTQVLANGFDPDEVWRLIQAEKITAMFAVPTMINMMREAAAHEHYSHDSLRWIMCGAAPVPVTLIDAYAGMGIDIHQVYGSTETHGGIAILPPAYAHSRKGSTGLACFGVELKIVDRENRELGPDEKGDIIARGPFLFREYWHMSEETERSFDHGWFSLGDIGYLDSEGFLTISDRSKDMIISGGENVYPAEVEDALMRCENVLEIAVIGQPDEKWGEVPVAVVVRRDAGISLEQVTEELHRICEKSLSSYKQPRRYVFADELPRNASGKVLKHVLRKSFLQGEKANG